jgi:putative flippase GtrA
MRSLLAPAARFAAAGLLNTLVGFAAIVAALRLGFGDVAANLIGFGIGLAVGFVINRQWTFRAEGEANPAEIARYLAAFAVSWSLNIAAVLIGVRLGMAGSVWVQLAGMAVYSVTFFALSRWFVFASDGPASGPASGR